MINQLAEQGVAILMVSSELPEVLGMSDRIMVMQNGRIRGILTRQEASEEKIMEYATGSDRPADGNGSHEPPPIHFSIDKIL